MGVRDARHHCHSFIGSFSDSCLLPQRQRGEKGIQSRVVYKSKGKNTEYNAKYKEVSIQFETISLLLPFLSLSIPPTFRVAEDFK